MARRYDIDWEVIERDYSIGILTIRQIAEKHQVDISAISRHAKKDEWSRDLGEQVRAATKAKVATSLAIAHDVDVMHKAKHIKSIQSDAFTVELSSNQTFEIVRKHHQNAAKLEKLMLKMVDELQDQADNFVGIEQLKTMVFEHDPNAAQAIHRLTSLGSRMSTLKAATEIHERIVKIERQAFNIDAEEKHRLPELERAIFALRDDPRYKPDLICLKENRQNGD